jgi:hypothetical protein
MSGGGQPPGAPPSPRPSWGDLNADPNDRRVRTDRTGLTDPDQVARALVYAAEHANRLRIEEIRYLEAQNHLLERVAVALERMVDSMPKAEERPS